MTSSVRPFGCCFWQIEDIFDHFYEPVLIIKQQQPERGQRPIWQKVRNVFGSKIT